jgi:hypothetical protein
LTANSPTGNNKSSFIISYISNFSTAALDFCVQNPPSQKYRCLPVQQSRVRQLLPLHLNVLRTRPCRYPHYPQPRRLPSSPSSPPPLPAEPQLKRPLTHPLHHTVLVSGSSIPALHAQPGLLTPHSPTPPLVSPPTIHGAALPATSAASSQVDYDLEVRPLSDSYVCSPENCQPPQALDLGAFITGTTPNSTVYSPLPLPTGYFNLDPVIFSTHWGIFTGKVPVTSYSGAATSTPSSTQPGEFFHGEASWERDD